jgi:DNA-binding transcriptional ArsR family regulator
VSSRSPAASGAGRGGPLPPLLHGRVRLLIISHLVKVGAPVPFTELRAELGLTAGTLSVHLSRLSDGGIVEIQKRFVEKRPQTLVAMTSAGKRRFAAYVKELKQIVPGLA